MDSNYLVHELVEQGVLVREDSEFELSDGLRERIDTRTSEFESEPTTDLRSFAREVAPRETLVDEFVALAECDPRSLAEVTVLRDECDDLAPEVILQLLPVFRRFRSLPEPTSGVPDPFVPVQGDHLPALTGLYRHVLVYVWLEDSEPCEAMKERLETEVTYPDSVLLFAVFGPTAAETLDSEYTVTGGPTLLTMKDGAPESRMYGITTTAAIESELQILTED